MAPGSYTDRKLSPIARSGSNKKHTPVMDYRDRPSQLEGESRGNWQERKGKPLY